MAYAALVACSGGAFSSTPDGAGDKDTGGTDTNGATAGKATTGGAESVAGSNHGGASGGRPGGSGGSTSRSGGVVSAGAGGKPITVGGTSPVGGGGAGGSGPDTPAIPTDGLLLWFRADVGFKESASGSVWQDQSGNELDATQALAEFSPTLATSPDLPMPVVQFDGTDDLMELPELDVPVDAGLSIFAVAGRGVDSKCSAVIELSNGPEVDDINLGSLGNTFQYEVFTDSVPAQDNAFPLATMRLLEVLHAPDPNKPLAELRINGTLTASRDIPPPAKTTRSTNFIGHTLYGDCLSTYSGAIAEIIFYARKVTTQERIVVEKYLMTKWAL